MCTTCGCDGGATAHEHDRGVPFLQRDVRPGAPRGLTSGSVVEGGLGIGRTVSLEHRLLAKNDRLAEENRARLAELGVLALNILGAPGAGKTALLERTIREVLPRGPVYVIEGDQATENDAARVRAAGARAVQVNTGAGCHLDAGMVARALDDLDPEPGATLLIENVGNLVCPALFDLGERAKVVVMSVTEGDDKPLKYPHIFRASQALVLNKLDLLPHVPFDVSRCLAAARQVNPDLEVFQVSATRGDGLATWCACLLAGWSPPG